MLTTEQVGEFRSILEALIKDADQQAMRFADDNYDRLALAWRGRCIGLQQVLTELNRLEPHELVVKDVTEEFYAKPYNSQPALVDPA